MAGQNKRSNENKNKRHAVPVGCSAPPGGIMAPHLNERIEEANIRHIARKSEGP
jgi:hypothetical protein